MAIVRVAQPYKLLTDPVWSGDILRSSSSSIVIAAGSLRIEYSGQFRYSIFGDVSGTLTGVREFNAGGLFYEITNAKADAAIFQSAIDIGNTFLAAREVLKGSDAITGSSGDDQIFGFAGDDLMSGGRGADELRGNEGQDTLRGGAGDDYLVGGSEADRLDGGAGNDTASYFEAARGVVVGLSSGARRTGEAAGDLLASIENLVGSRYRDTLSGDKKANRFEGFDGSDKLFGEGGDDVLSGGNGNDVLTGGAGADYLMGGQGRDRFVFAQTTDSGRRAPDRIDGFDAPGRKRGDIVDLSAIDADLTKAGNQAFLFDGGTGTGRLYVRDRGGDTVIYGNTDRDRTPELKIVIRDGEITSSSYTVDDFIL